MSCIFQKWESVWDQKWSGCRSEDRTVKENLRFDFWVWGLPKVIKTPTGRTQRMAVERGVASMDRRGVPTWTVPSSPTGTRVCRLQTKGHHGLAGAERGAERFSTRACCRAACAVVPSSDGFRAG